MEYELASFGNGRYRVESFAMPRGEAVQEEISTGLAVMYVVFGGQISVTYAGRDRPKRHLIARRSAPIFLTTPGTYHVIADRSAFGIRGVAHGYRRRHRE